MLQLFPQFVVFVRYFPVLSSCRRWCFIILYCSNNFLQIRLKNKIFKTMLFEYYLDIPWKTMVQNTFFFYELEHVHEIYTPNMHLNVTLLLWVGEFHRVRTSIMLYRVNGFPVMSTGVQEHLLTFTMLSTFSVIDTPAALNANWSSSATERSTWLYNSELNCVHSAFTWSDNTCNYSA